MTSQKRLYIVVGMVLALVIQDTAVVSNNTIGTVRRRSSGDVWHYLFCDAPYCHTSCSANTTYLVDEEQCIDNSNFFDKCSFAIAPTGEPHLLRLITGLNGLSSLQTFSSNSTPTDALVVQESTRTQVNSSICDISSLEVYRGREQAIEISHEGFSLGNSGTIEVDVNQLEYNSTEYEGELFRMNLSCNSFDLYNYTDPNPPVDSCLFFKVFGNANITDAKFDCLVSGTIDSSPPCSLRTVTDKMGKPETTMTTLALSSPQMSTTQNVEASVISTSKSTPSNFVIGSPLFYGVIVGGSVIIIILLLCVVAISVVGWRRGCYRKNTSGTKSKEQLPEYEDVVIRNSCSSAATNGYNGHLLHESTMNMNGSNSDDSTMAIAEGDFASHTYQEIGATYQEIMPTAGAKDPSRNQSQLRVTNLVCLSVQLNSAKESQEYSRLNHEGDQTALNHLSSGASTGSDCEQYAKLNGNEFHKPH